ncbi:hypothetical protein KM043_004172 [Ampulex compressa]|nr:hypothetical protein KM043_004172 [Ampulex compressa]
MGEALRVAEDPGAAIKMLRFQNLPRRPAARPRRTLAVLLSKFMPLEDNFEEKQRVGMHRAFRETSQLGSGIIAPMRREKSAEQRCDPSSAHSWNIRREWSKRRSDRGAPDGGKRFQGRATFTPGINVPFYSHYREPKRRGSVYGVARRYSGL